MNINERRLKKIVAEEVVLWTLKEGMWDDVKDGVAKLRRFVSNRFKQAVAGWSSAVQEKLQNASTVPDDVTMIISALKHGMQETGESVKLDDSLQAAKELGNMGTNGALAAVQADLAGPVHDFAAAQKGSPKQESVYYASVYSIMVEGQSTSRDKQLNEAGVVTALGLALGLMGGLPLLFKGLAKLAHVLHAEKTAQLLEKAEHVVHAFEKGVLNVTIPDRLAYVVYKFLHNKGFKLGNGDLLRREQFKNSEHSQKTKGLIYKALLVYFAFNGIIGAMKAGVSMFGFVEGAATTVKGIEIAAGASELAAIAKSV